MNEVKHTDQMGREDSAAMETVRPQDDLRWSDDSPESSLSLGGSLFQLVVRSRPVTLAFGHLQWRDYLLFYEYFHGDTGAGVGASHQTGWTGAIARMIHLFASVDQKEMLGQKMDDSVAASIEPRTRATSPTAKR